MHTAMYQDHPEVGCVLHTHSPYATAYAVAHRRIGCWVEAMAMFGLADGVRAAALQRAMAFDSRGTVRA
jgi:L-ribulose-5-phosphate 4-epimerase